NEVISHLNPVESLLARNYKPELSGFVDCQILKETLATGVHEMVHHHEINNLKERTKDLPPDKVIKADWQFFGTDAKWYAIPHLKLPRPNEVLAGKYDTE